MIVDRLFWKARCVNVWLIVINLCGKVQPKLFGSNDESDTDNRGSRSGSVAGRDSNEAHWSFFEFETVNYGDTNYREGSRMWMWYVAGGVAILLVFCLCKKSGFWKTLDFSLLCGFCGGLDPGARANNSRERKERLEAEEEERQARKLVRDLELKKLVQGLSANTLAAAPTAPSQPIPPPSYAQASTPYYSHPQYQCPPPHPAFFVPRHPGPEVPGGQCNCNVQDTCSRCSGREEGRGGQGRDKTATQTVNVTVKGATNVYPDLPDRMSSLDPDRL